MGLAPSTAVVDGCRRTVVDGEDRAPERAPADPEVVEVDAVTPVVELCDSVVVVDSGNVVVGVAGVVVEEPGRSTSCAPAGARAIPTTTIVTSATTTAARCRTPTRAW
ncbi:MAG: hypothetical protein KY438_11460 [Actinobacteria bacterium]|nr:hypothetical protein [Actinomycetota bacterium]